MNVHRTIFNRTAFFGFGMLVLLLAATMPASAQISYMNDVQTIFTESCVNRGCHPGGGAPFSLREEVSYANLVNAPVAVPDCGADFRVVPFDTDASMLYLRITGRTPCVRMPLIGDTLSAAEQSTIGQWITEGAFNDIPCEDIDFFNAKCNMNGAGQAMVKFLNSTEHAGKTIGFQLDATVYPIVLVTNGTHTLGKIAVPHIGMGSHTLTLINPQDCFEPVTFNCQVDRQSATMDEFDRLWAESETWEVVPSRTTLFGNYPNPFNPSTTIRYTLAANTHVTLKVYSMLGQEIATLTDGVQTAGEHSVVWDARTSTGTQVAAGVYLYTLVTADYTQTAKMVIIK